MDKKKRWGVILIIIGIIFALKNIFNINLHLPSSFSIEWNKIWPIFLILLGAIKLLKK